MADTKTIPNGQILVNCQLCEIEEKIQWKCIECDLLMCDKCKRKIHPKFRKAKDHKIVDIKDVGQHEDQLDFTNITCPQHAGHSCCLFCLTCDNLVCSSCVSKVHKKHDLAEISEAYDMKQQKLKEKESQIQKNKETVAIQLKQLDELKITEQSKYTRVCQEIITQEKALKTAVEKYAEELQNELDDNWETIQQSIKSDQEEVSTATKHVNELEVKVKNILKISDAAKFFEAVVGIENSMEVEVPEIMEDFSPLPHFLSGQINQSNLGVLQNVREPPNVKLVLVKQFTTAFPKLSLLTTTPDDSIWVASSALDILEKVKPTKNHHLNILFSFNFRVYGMAVTPTNQLLLVTDKPILKSINCKTGDVVDSKYNAGELIPLSVHVTREEKVMIGVKSKGRNFPSVGKRAVIVFDKEGNQEKEYEFTKNNKTILTYPSCITSTRKGNICVVDILTEDFHSRLVVLGKSGEIKGVYNGLNDSSKSFYQTDVVTTPQDNLIATDIFNNLLHILDNSGKLLTYFDTKSSGILNPFSLDYNVSGQLYIGCGRSKGSTEMAKIYEVDISGC